ncbi:CUB and sushi domain-containing protein 1-like isoform X2 [Dreissena polymorpha]|uniref:CUB and sushi domain-containing protein 1-like isoform X2 n=1 Tax=Dreissena polymorpha TaxID=45954 RepID=UPI002264E658|nr:CUB and sushi domain-containing protein 1-like isoform X2 [Dreissena polymorpha]
MTLRCAVGYWLLPASKFGQPQTTQTVRCGLNGTWTPAANCTMITCPALNGEHTNDSHWHSDAAALNNATEQNYDAQMTLRCAVGYWLLPASKFGQPQTTQTVRCGLNGTWTPAANCTMITCPALWTKQSQASHWQLANATLSNATKMNYDANVQLKCDDGYWLQNTSTHGNPNTTQRVKCRLNGDWTPAEDCSMINCGKFTLDDQNSDYAQITWHSGTLFGDVIAMTDTESWDPT